MTKCPAGTWQPKQSVRSPSEHIQDFLHPFPSRDVVSQKKGAATRLWKGEMHRFERRIPPGCTEYVPYVLMHPHGSA